MRVLVTGCAGFIGFHLCKRLFEEGLSFIGIDNLNNYYDVNLKKKRLNFLEELSNKNNISWRFFNGDLKKRDFLEDIFTENDPKIVLHLAAQAGVRYSIENPNAYIDSNIVGFQNVLDNCRKFEINNFIYASSSSVYGGNTKVPFSEDDPVNHPVSLYAATKRSNELMAHCYSHLYGIPSIGLRFFTVYGPWGRPDMAPMIFAKSILSKKPIKVFNFGQMSRDFTFIDDVIETIFRLLNKPARSDKSFNRSKPIASKSWSPHLIFNIGNGQPVSLLQFIEILEKELSVEAIKDFQPMQKGDVEATFADTSKIQEYVNFKPNTSIQEGISKFVKWYRSYY